MEYIKKTIDKSFDHTRCIAIKLDDPFEKFFHDFYSTLLKTPNIHGYNTKKIFN